MDSKKALLVFFLSFIGLVSSVPRNQNTDDENCGLNGYEAHCVLNIMEEHIEANAIVNHCHKPLDITFRVVYRYGNGTEQRWQYTFVTTNQNERVLIPGLELPPAPNALVYLYVRVPSPLFDLHNASLAAVEASFVAVVSETEWEEAEFLNEAVTVSSTEDCFSSTRSKDALLWIIGGTVLGLLFIAAGSSAVLWWCRRRRLALDELALVSSLETGLPGAQPYQIETVEQRLDNNNENDIRKGDNEGKERKKKAKNTSNKVPAFKFGKLKEEEVKERISKTLNKAVIIGNPVLVDKASAIQNRFNRMASVSPREPVTNFESVGDAFENIYTEDKRCGVADPKQLVHVDSSDNSTSHKQEKVHNESVWKKHPLEDSGGQLEENTKSGARPKEMH